MGRICYQTTQLLLFLYFVFFLIIHILLIALFFLLFFLLPLLKLVASLYQIANYPWACFITNEVSVVFLETFCGADCKVRLKLNDSTKFLLFQSFYSELMAHIGDER